jgi:mannosyltransferase OCH1-like enzyme
MKSIQNDNQIKSQLIKSNKIIPNIILYTWVSKQLKIPYNLQNWMTSCHNVNIGHSIHLYDDDELKYFVEFHYPEYLDLFRSLHGVCKLLSSLLN